MSRIVIGRAVALGSWLRSRHGMLLAGVLVPILVVAGTLWLVLGAGSHQDARKGASTGSSSAAPSPTTAGSSSGPSPAGPGGPTAAPGTPSPGMGPGDATAGFLTEVGAINPALIRDPASALAAGQATCQDIREQKADDALADAVIAHFKVPDVAITRTTAVLLADASRNHLCPS